MIDENLLLSQFDRNGSLSDADIEAFENRIKFSLPEDYAKFMKASNGGEGPIGKYGYARFWKLEEILELNRAYQVHEYAPGLFLFGSDGGGEAFAFDTRTLPMPVVEVTFISMGHDDVIRMANTFDEFLEKLGNVE